MPSRTPAYYNVQTVIIGGGQAGMALSHELAARSHDHLVLEQGGQVADSWRNKRWDSFCLVTPNWTFQMPGAAYGKQDPDGFMLKEKIVANFDDYARSFDLPIQYHTRVEAVDRQEDGRYQVHTDQGMYQAKNVIVATGFFQTPRKLPFSEELPKDILQLQTTTYRNPESLPPGAVLVLGSGQSGCQIAEEMYQSGRKVYLSTGATGRAPRRYRGKDMVAWLVKCGYYDRRPEQLESPKARFMPAPQLSGKNGGHSLNLHQFAREGVTLLGHVQAWQDPYLIFAPDLADNLRTVDRFEKELCKMVDGYIDRAGLDAPLTELPALSDGYAAETITALDLRQAGVQSIIWALGFSFDYSLVHLPIFDEYGYPVQQDGATNIPGLYFLGLHFLVNARSSLLFGVGEDATRMAGMLCKGGS